MIHLNDELLNAYIDNELDYSKISEINDHIKICSECLNKLKAMRGVENQLKNLVTYNTTDNFTLSVMEKINLSIAHFKPKKSYLFRFIFGFFVAITLGICVAAFAAITPAASSFDINTIVENVSSDAQSIFSSYKILFSKQIVSIIGGVLIISVFISIYFFYESHKNIKNRLNKL